MTLSVEVAVAKARKYAVSESGDTVEVIERPWGGLSIVLADGQSSGLGAKRVSNMAARKAVSLLAEGVRDGAAARAAHDYLRTHRQGKVSATLTIISVDLATRSLVISRNGRCPVVAVDERGFCFIDDPSEPIGVRASIKPAITELPLAAGTLIVAFSDGLWSAGERYGQRLDLETIILEASGQDLAPAALADSLLEQAVSLEQGRPADDISVLVLGVAESEQESDVRRMTVYFPVV